MLHFIVARTLQRDLDIQKRRVLRASNAAVRATIKKAEGIAKRQHSSLAGWKNESGNLQRMITGYVAGEDPYIHAGTLVVPKAPFQRGRYLVKNQAYLNDHYRVDRDVSPPINAVPEKIVGVLHSYMQYSNRLPGSGKKKSIREISIVTLEKNEALLLDFMAKNLAERL
jgi:hypothetical protein